MMNVDKVNEISNDLMDTQKNKKSKLIDNEKSKESANLDAHQNTDCAIKIIKDDAQSADLLKTKEFR